MQAGVRFAQLLTVAAALLGCSSPAPAGDAGFGRQTVSLDGTPIEVFTYRPAGCAVTGILLVFHGTGRNASGYRDDAVPLAQRTCMVIAAPLFDAARFPARSYQRGGIVGPGGMEPAADWTVRYVPLLAAWARQQEGQPDLPYSEIGHSAGAQFLSRVLAYTPDGARAAVVANPSTWVEASLDVAAPYGFGGVPDSEAALRRYLAAPVTVLLGQEDRGSYELAESFEARQQGANRFERGQNAFRQAQATARQHGWVFNWRLAVVPGVGHSAREMMASDAAFAALQR